MDSRVFSGIHETILLPDFLLGYANNLANLWE